MLPPLVSVLDPRPETESRKRPLRDAANIPWDEIRKSASELPPKSSQIELANCDHSDAAAEILESMGRHFRHFEPTRCERWELRRLWSPHPWAMDLAAQFSGKRVLDFGCGSGRDSACYTAYGCDVLAVDRLPEALAQAENMCARYGTVGHLTTRAADSLNELKVEGPFDLILTVMAFHEDWLAQAPSLLRPGSMWFIEAFAPESLATGHPRSPKMTLDVRSLPPPFRVVRTEHLGNRVRALLTI